MIQNDMERVIKNKKNLELKTPEGAPDTSLIDANETPDVFQFLMNDNQLEPNASIPMPAPLPENMDDNLIVRPVIPSLQKDKATPQ